MEGVLRPLSVVGGALIVTLVVGWLADHVLRRVDARHPETPLWDLLHRCRLPLQVVLCTALLRGSFRSAGAWATEHEEAIGQVLTLVLIGACAWLLVRVAVAIVEASYARYAARAADAARVRRVRTQVTLIQRVVTAAVCVVAVAAMLLTFPAMRTAGVSVLASAGLIGIVAGVAAQSTLANLFAGLQIAFGDIVRIGDTVVVDGEWGRVEEITLTYLVVTTWDERRITMPVSYFTGRPFENWSRSNPRMTGTVFLHLDHSTPIDLMRERLHEILQGLPEWDGRAWSLVITDTTPSTIQVRALVTAKDADDIWALRCVVRERLIEWLRREHPYALPRINTAPAPGLEQAPDRRQTPPTSEDIGPGPGTT
ncbi:mechanosensitive ion channel family protein [Streptomyces roseoverticillatus]|uniref:mechanosensitive ion channel family protein n=1 Tax=Streptomyces roseoverticillatus TaxID=66429 RepID=UPI0004BF1D0D|nr:mechanosensitive ion channel domain-containing protein [Streptomyces roseoverticillatus]